MSGSWIQECKRILDEIKKIENIKGRDRLDMVRTIRFTLYSLQRSISGWFEWVDNPDIMSSFSLEELKEIGKNLAKLTQGFIEYDCETTSRAQQNLDTEEPKTRSAPAKKVKEKRMFYVN